MLIKQLSTLGFHAVIAGIALPNEASIALFESDSQGLQVIITNFYLIDFMFFPSRPITEVVDDLPI